MSAVVYLAGGCFWGVQGYFDRLNGVIESSVGYANSIIPNPSYEDVCAGVSGASECLELVYDDRIMPLFAGVRDVDSANKSSEFIESISANFSDITTFSQLQDCILLRFLSIINPFSINRQGNDIGTQYRSGIYTIDSVSLSIVKNFINIINKLYGKAVAIEIMPLQNFYKAEEYHQKYLQKHPNGYCHIDISKADRALIF